MSAKQEVLDLIKKLPEESSTTDIMSELYFKSKVEKGLKDIEEGRLLSQDEVEHKMRTWAKSIGQK